MRSLLLILTALFTVQLCTAQTNVVSWNFSAKKVADKAYEIHLKASVDAPWHIYSQTTPEGGPVATKIIFNKNPLINLNGTTKESGKLFQKHEDVFGVDVKYFDGEVDFIQIVKLKAKAKTNLSGTVEFMTCNDTQCLPPRTVNFNIELQ